MSRNSLPKMKDVVYIINLHEYKSVGTHCIAFHVNGDNVAYLDSFRVEYIPKEIEKFHKQQKYQNKHL